MPSNWLRISSLLALLTTQTLAADGDWLSPVYNHFYQFPLPVPPTKTPKATYTNPTTGVPIDYYEIEIKPYEQQVYPGLKPARGVGYDGMSPGPTFKVEKGRESVVRFINRAGDRASAVHLHGSYSRAPFDGWAEDVIEVGQYKDYYYPGGQSARTLWYHDHAIHHTAENAYYGQAGFYILHDPAEDKLGLPAGKYDVPLAISAKQYNADGTLFDPAAERDSLWGDVIQVNGQPWPYLSVEPRKYRFRLLDTSVSRGYKLYAEADGSTTKIPFHVIGSDTGLLTGPVSTDTVELSGGERWEIVFDFAGFAGKNITLKNFRDVQVDDDFNGTDRIMRFVVGNTVTDKTNNNLPSALRTIDLPPPKAGVDKSFKFGRSNGEWQLNGVTFADVANRIIAKPARGTVEVWEFENNSGGWSHPVHVHLVDFQVISRTGNRPLLPYESAGLKDVVWLGRGEVIRVIAKYAPWDGVYMFHCHNLIHEDHDMMAAFNVTALQNFGYSEKTSFIDPMEARWRAKPINSADFTAQAIQNRLAEFSSLDAYRNAHEVELALDAYWKNQAAGGNTLVTSVTPAPAGTTAAVPATTAPAAAPVATTSTRRTTTTRVR